MGIIENEVKVHSTNIIILILFLCVVMIGLYPYHSGTDIFMISVFIVGILFRVNNELITNVDYILDLKELLIENIKILVVYYCWNTFISINIKEKLGVNLLDILDHIPMTIIFTAFTIVFSFFIISKIEDRKKKKILYYILYIVNVLIFCFLAK